MIRAGVIVCLFAIALGPLYTEAGYDWTRHSVSELAAQNTGNAWIMRLGLFSLGSATVFGYFRERGKFNIFFLSFGFFIALSALLSHKPIIEGRPYSELLDQLHSACASLAGFSAVAGFVLKAVQTKAWRRKLTYASIATAYTILPLGMFELPEYQGVFQRIIFGSFILWVLIDNPSRDQNKS
jgi:putative copper export protein